MLALLKLVKLNFLKYLDFIVPITFLVTGLYAGWYFTSNYYQGKESRAKDAIIEQLAKQAEINRKVSENFQVDVAKLRESYVVIGRKLNAKKVTVAPCTVNADGIRLWNESLLGKAVLPEDSPGTTGTETTDFARAFENKLANDQQCNELRSQQDGIKKWQKETYGE